MKQSLNSIEHLQTGISEQISYRVPNQSIVLQAKDIRKHFDHNGKSFLPLDGVNLNIKKAISFVSSVHLAVENPLFLIL